MAVYTHIPTGASVTMPDRRDLDPSTWRAEKPKAQSRRRSAKTAAKKA
jgi:hypothetical protein